MAIWQFTICFIPRLWAMEKDYNTSVFWVKGGYTTQDAWQESVLTPTELAILSSILPEAESWSQATLFW